METQETEHVVVPALLVPMDGTPEVISTEKDFEKALVQLAQGSGAFAVDAERASGYKYSQRAYLIQIKRTNGGLHLIDPIPFAPHDGEPHPLFAQLNEILRTDEVILHASTQDLPCLREVGVHPKKLFDTELGGRIAGLPRVGLGPLVEAHLGFVLAKEHSAVDWSTRPLPLDWLTYAALDVELLIELREKISGILERQGKSAWAAQEFEAILNAPAPPPRVDPWRRTSGMHKIKRRDRLAIIKTLWHARDTIARETDIAPGKLLTDSAILELALHAPTTRKELEKVLRPLGMRARWLERSQIWLDAICDGVAVPESHWPQIRLASDALPPVKIWRDRHLDKYAHLSHARLNLEKMAESLSIPVENLISPDSVRRICWTHPSDVALALGDLGARAWQIEIVAPILAQALTEVEPGPEIPEIPEVPESAESDELRNTQVAKIEPAP